MKRSYLWLACLQALAPVAARAQPSPPVPSDIWQLHSRHDLGGIFCSIDGDPQNGAHISMVTSTLFPTGIELLWWGPNHAQPAPAPFFSATVTFAGGATRSLHGHTTVLTDAVSLSRADDALTPWMDAFAAHPALTITPEDASFPPLQFNLAGSNEAVAKMHACMQGQLIDVPN